MTALLIIAVLVDLALAALLVAVSGFVTGGGPESMNAHGFAAAAYWAAVVVCVVAAFAGFILNRKGKTLAALVFAWLPPAGALVAALMPAPY
ncbi:MAG TPA: hypothetical protein VFP74_03260 [Pseudolabrys sp.]|jgi:hypothetical protein|nr:hypothetical protein [Pseudolabrys sp.]